MSIKGELHRLVDELGEDQCEEARRILEELRAKDGAESDDESLSPETLAAIEEGLADIKAGRTITLEELERKYGL